MDVRRKTRKRRQPVELHQATPAPAPRAANDLPPQLIPFVDALAELLANQVMRELQTPCNREDDNAT